MRNRMLSFLFYFILSIYSNTIQSQDFSNFYEKTVKSVVTINTSEYKLIKNELRKFNALGSGVIISHDGLVLTASHVIESSNTIKISLFDGQTVEADVVSANVLADIALLKMREIPSNMEIAKTGSSENLSVGNQIMVIGSPLGLVHSLSVGHVSGKMNGKQLLNGQQVKLIQTDASINHGNSGGPMFNMAGEVVGIVSYILSESGGFEGIGFGIAINSAMDILFENNAFWTGFNGFFLDESLAGIFNIPAAKSGLLVQHVVKNSFAERAGLKGGFFEAEILGQKLWLGGDIILSIQGIQCDAPHNFNTIKKQINALEPGQNIIITVLRKGEEIILSASN